MHENYYNPQIIDPAALFITQQEFADMVNKLKISDKGGDEVTIPMNFSD